MVPRTIIKTNLKARFKMVNNNKCNNPFNWSSLFTIFFRLDLKGKNVREEPKGIVFLSKLMLQLKNKEVVLAGDGRHDSMGHSAKYGTYTMFCCTIGLIIHIVLVQVCMLLCLPFVWSTLMVNSIFGHQILPHYVNWIFCCCFKKLHFHVFALDSFI